MNAEARLVFSYPRGTVRCSTQPIGIGRRFALSRSIVSVGGWLPTIYDHLDDIWREEGKRERAANMRHLLTVSRGDLGDGRGAACAEIFEPAVGMGDQTDQFWVGRSELGGDIAHDQPDLLATTQRLGRHIDRQRSGAFFVGGLGLDPRPRLDQSVDHSRSIQCDRDPVPRHSHAIDQPAKRMPQSRGLAYTGSEDL
ncbi:MAG: hypothetical protein WD229_08525 [Pirellulales bacterium]